MRIALALIAVGIVGCVQPPPDEPTGDPQPGYSGPGGGDVYSCEGHCGSRVCARDGLCYPASEVRSVHAAWTVHGQTASMATCGSEPDLFIAFRGRDGEYLGYAPVPCRAGGYYMDKISTSYTTVELGPDGASFGTTAAIGSDGEAVIALP